MSKFKLIKSDSLEIFKQNTYAPTNIGLVSSNAYLSIVTTNNCQMSCPYCINSETDHSLNLNIDKAVSNIASLVRNYGIKEAIMLGGEPLLHPDLFGLIAKLRNESGLKMLRLTTNGIKLKNNPRFIKKLVDKDDGIQGINISFHNEDFMTYEELRQVVEWIKYYNSEIKIRININIWKGNLDSLQDLLDHLRKISFADEFRVSNIIPKDSFSVNPINKEDSLVLSDEQYVKLFNSLIGYYIPHYAIFENEQTLGFVKYVLIATPSPIIINWNIGSTVSRQVCENNIETREINTFKCLVSGDISLSWNENNIVNINPNLFSV